MSKLYLQLGKMGDILNILPILYDEYNDGVKPLLMVARKYASIFDWVTYVEPVVFEGETHEIGKAYHAAKGLADQIVCTQVNGPKEETLAFAYEPAGLKHAVTDSFARESWKIAGKLERWGKVPLYLDAVKPVIPEWKRRTIVVHTSSQTSPFPHAKLLLKLLQLRFSVKGWNVVEMTGEESFAEQYGMIKSAWCFVCVDTMQLHLAYAIQDTPVMALVQDAPAYWNGSPWRPNHYWHCRYGHFPDRAVELLDAIETCREEKELGVIAFPQFKIDEFASCRGFKEFPIYQGVCPRDSLNCVGDKERYPMLRNVIKMALSHKNSYGKKVVLARPNTLVTVDLGEVDVPCYSYRTAKDDENNPVHWSIVDMFCAPAATWENILPLVPDMVMGKDSMWSRVLLEIFRKHGAIEVEGAFRNAN